MNMDGFRPIELDRLDRCGSFQVVADGSGGLEMVLGEWFWVVTDVFVWLPMVLGGFSWFALLEATFEKYKYLLYCYQ